MDQSSEASTLDALITRLQSGSPGSASGADRAAQRLVELAAAQRAPDRLRDPVRILAQVQSPGSPGWRLRTPRPLLLVPFVALALAVIAAWPRLSTTEAVELIGRAEDVASGAAPLSTSSYTGTVTVQVRLSELSPFSSGASAQGQITETVHFSAPASVRVDIPGAASLISNGREGWLVDARAGTAQRLESAKLNAANPLNFADLPSFLRSLSRDYDVALAGTSLVAGREAQEVVLHSRAGSPAAATVRELRLFIDKALAIELKGEARSDTGEIVVAWEFIDFAANVAQDPALFAFVPGPGVRVIESTATTGSGVAGWRVVAARASFSTFAPVYLPGAVQDGYPSYDATTGTIVVAYRSAGRDALLLLERAAPAAHPLLPGSEVSVGGVRGFLERRDGRTYVRLDREGTRIELSAADGSGVGIEELLRIADGLRSVQR